MKTKLLCLAASAVIALTSFGAVSATIITEAPGEYSNDASSSTSIGMIGPGTTTFIGTIDPSQTPSLPSTPYGQDEDYFSFTSDKAITSIVITYDINDDPAGNVTLFQVFEGLKADGSSKGSVLTGDATGLFLAGPLAAGDYTIYIRETELGSLGPNSYEVSVNAVPLPAAAWLFGSALLGLVTVSRRRAAAKAA